MPIAVGRRGLGWMGCSGTAARCNRLNSAASICRSSPLRASHSCAEMAASHLFRRRSSVGLPAGSTTSLAKVFSSSHRASMLQSCSATFAGLLAGNDLVGGEHHRVGQLRCPRRGRVHHPDRDQIGVRGDIDLQMLAQRLGGDPVAAELDRMLQDGWRAQELRPITKRGARRVGWAIHSHAGDALIERRLASRPTITKQRPEQHRRGDQPLVPPDGLEQATHRAPAAGLPVDGAYRLPRCVAVAAVQGRAAVALAAPGLYPLRHARTGRMVLLDENGPDGPPAQHAGTSPPWCGAPTSGPAPPGG